MYNYQGIFFRSNFEAEGNFKHDTPPYRVFCLFVIAFLLFSASEILAQGVGVNSSGNPADPSAGLDVDFTNKGTLITRMNTAQRDAISNPAQGLMIYNTDCNALNIYNGTSWISVGNIGGVNTPGAIIGNISPCQNSSGNVYSIASVSGAGGYNWTVPNGSSITGGQGTTSIIVNIGGQSGNICVIASNNCSSSNTSCLDITLSTSVPTVPTAGIHAQTQTQITWNWNTVSGAIGYKYNTVNDYGTATDNGTSTSYTQTGLTCNTAYTLHIWAYNSCGNSSSTALNQTTIACVSCPATLTINHTVGTVAPVTKTVTYGVVLTNLSGTDKCWITRNLGATNQAASATDNTEASAGWYWQFNRKQGYQYTTTRTPNTAWINPISEASDWLPANDPCTIELGAGWRMPTKAEWTNAITNGAWANRTDAHNSVLKLHAAGWLGDSGGAIGDRGVRGDYWSNAQNGNTNGWYLEFESSYSTMNINPKSFGRSLRCIKD